MKNGKTVLRGVCRKELRADAEKAVRGQKSIAPRKRYSRESDARQDAMSKSSGAQRQGAHASNEGESSELGQFWRFLLIVFEANKKRGAFTCQRRQGSGLPVFSSFLPAAMAMAERTSVIWFVKYIRMSGQAAAGVSISSHCKRNAA